MISIVTAYHNRKDLFHNTLKTINKFKGDMDIEVIAVDDCSSDEHRIEDLVELFPFLKIIRLESMDKKYVNPCIVFNKGFKEAKGDIIILQNPECLHVGDILNKASNISDNEYISFGCYSIDRDKTETVKNILNEDFDLDKLLTIIEPNYSPVSSDGQNGWYNHSILRPVGYHFCSVIKRHNLKDLGGFDERFGNGIAYDDNEILIRIHKKGLKVKIINQPFVAHQWHYSSNNYQHLNVQELLDKNRKLLEIIRQEPNWQSNR